MDELRSRAPGEEPELLAHIQRGLQGIRTIAIPEGHDDQEFIEGADFERWAFVPGYEAIWRSGEVECQLIGGGWDAAQDPQSVRLAVARQCGVGEDWLFAVNHPDYDPASDSEPPPVFDPVELFRLEGISVQLRMATPEYTVLVASGHWEVRTIGEQFVQRPVNVPKVYPSDLVTLAFRGSAIDSEATAAKVLERFPGAIAFQFDVNVGPDTHLSVLRTPRPNPSPQEDLAFGFYSDRYLFTGQVDPSRLPMPTAELGLDPEALSLYWAARAATATPLYQFVAYYQVLEYYLPRFSVSLDDRKKLRWWLSTGSVDAANDAHLDKIIRLAQGATRSERDQLSRAIEAWVDPKDLSAVLNRKPMRWSWLRAVRRGNRTLSHIP